MVDPDQWQQDFNDAFARIAGLFRRREPRLNARSYLLAVLSDVGSRNGWQLAEQAGHATPYRLQRLLGEAKWDADDMRDQLRGYVVDELGDPNATLIGDDSGDLKSGSHTVGTQRQYTGTAGRIENCQIATYLAYASSHGRALIDRELYLPKSWTDDPARCRAAGVPDDTEFATKITHLQKMIKRALEAAVPFTWVTADEFYGNHRGLRRDLQAARRGYVLGVAKNHRITRLDNGLTATAEHVAAQIPTRAWRRLSAGKGAKGDRDYDWARVRITSPKDEAAGHHWLLLRRRIRDGELAFYRCWSPTNATMADLVRVAGIRWCVEECFQAGKGEVGLDQHQVRTWTSWYRYTTLAMFAHAFLAATAARERRKRPQGTNKLIPLTVNEIRHLFAKLVTHAAFSFTHWLHWSHWRRRHQHNALISHYARRGATIDHHPSL